MTGFNQAPVILEGRSLEGHSVFLIWAARRWRCPRVLPRSWSAGAL